MVVAKVEDLNVLSESLQDAIAALNKQVSDMHLEMKKASQNREKENKDFQAAEAELMEAVDMLRV